MQATPTRMQQHRADTRDGRRYLRRAHHVAKQALRACALRVPRVWRAARRSARAVVRMQCAVRAVVAWCAGRCCASARCSRSACCFSARVAEGKVRAKRRTAARCLHARRQSAWRQATRGAGSGHEMKSAAKAANGTRRHNGSDQKNITIRVAADVAWHGAQPSAATSEPYAFMSRTRINQREEVLQERAVRKEGGIRDARNQPPVALPVTYTESGFRPAGRAR